MSLTKDAKEAKKTVRDGIPFASQRASSAPDIFFTFVPFASFARHISPPA